MKPENVKKIRSANQTDPNTLSREELFDHCAVSILLDIIEKGKDMKAFEVLANHFPDDMPAILKEAVQEE